MKNTIILLTILISTLIWSCNAKVQEVKDDNGKVSLICLKENDTVYVKVTNGTKKAIYVPQKYSTDYTNNDDTLHFETESKAKYRITKYYKYKNIFPFEFYTTREVAGSKPDSIEQVKQQFTYFNEFIVGPMVPVKPGTSYVAKLEFNAPKYTTVIQAVYYNEPFLDERRLKKFDYTYKDFIEFDSLNALYATAPILIRYR